MFTHNIHRLHGCRHWLILYTSIAFVTSTSPADIIIDTFEQGPFHLTDSNSTPNPSLGQGSLQGLTTSNVIKAIRHIDLNTSGSGDDAAEFKLQIISADNGVEMISNSAPSELHYILSYSGFLGFPSATNLNTDFSQNAAGFLFTFDRVDFTLAATVRVNSSVPLKTTNAIATIFINHPGTYFIPYDDFDDSDPIVDFGWANVRRITVDFNISSPDTLGTVRLTDFRAGFDIPEPTSLSLLTLAACGLTLRRTCGITKI